MAKGMSIISSVIFLAIVLAAVFLIYEAGVPVVQKMQASAVTERMKGVFADLDSAIQQTASEGKGSKRVLYMKIDPGNVFVNSTEDAIYWELETTAEVVSPRTSQRFGNMVIGSNMETRGYEGNYTLSSPETECYILENEHLMVFVKKIGSPESHESYAMSDLLAGVYSKDTGQWMGGAGLLDISMDFNETSQTGQGYTEMSPSGYNLPYSAVSAFMDSSYMDYYVNFTLGSGADFLEMEASA